MPTSHQLSTFTSLPPRLLSSLEKITLNFYQDRTPTNLSGPLKIPNTSVFPSSLPPIGCWFCPESQTPVPPSSFSGKTQFPAVNSQIPTHFSKFDLHWHLSLPFALLSKYLAFLSCLRHIHAWLLLDAFLPLPRQVFGSVVSLPCIPHHPLTSSSLPQLQSGVCTHPLFIYQCWLSFS